MATTGLWPVKGRLKDVIDYAQNPEKTDSDLWQVLNYSSDSNKTEKQLYVSGINCIPRLAYQQMMTTKKKYGKTGGNVAYHSFQSFVAGEVTPEQAHSIGMETARQMWGDDYEVIVSTHLNTDNLHNHFVINSVSFKTGRKFENHISDHRKLREISDAICKEYGKSVLENSSFYSKSKRDYWPEKKGTPTHRQILKRDVDKVLSECTNFYFFEVKLKSLGYTVTRSRDHKHYSVKALTWERAVRLESLGTQYSVEKMEERLIRNKEFAKPVPLLRPVQPKRKCPLYDYENLFRKIDMQDTVEQLLGLMLELIEYFLGINNDIPPTKPLSPEMRKELKRYEKIAEQYSLVRNNDIDSLDSLLQFIDTREQAIADLVSERQSIYNLNRHKNDEGLNSMARDISARIKPLRKELKTAREIFEKTTYYKKVLAAERKLERAAIERERGSR